MNASVNKLAMMEVADPFNLSSMDSASNYNSDIKKMIHNRVTAGANVLDFGAGKGTFANSFSHRITCVEPDERVSAAIDRKHQVVPSLLSVSEPMDFIYSINVLEHIEDDVASLAGIGSVLREGGSLFLLLPARNEIYTEMDNYVGHHRRYDIADIRSKLYATGFRIVDFQYFDIAGYFSTLFCKYAGKLIGWKGSLTPGSVAAYDRFVYPFSSKMDALTCGSVIGKNILVDAIRI